MTATKNIGPILATVRREKNIKSELIARHLGVSVATYSQIETGRRAATFERIVLICHELDLSLENLVALYQQNTLLDGGDAKWTHQ